MRRIDLASGVLAAGLATLATQTLSWPGLIVGFVAWTMSIPPTGVHSSAALRTLRHSVAMFLAAVVFTGTILVSVVPILGVPLRFSVTWTVVLMVAGLGGRWLAFSRFVNTPVGLALALNETTLDGLWSRLAGYIGAGYEVRAAINPVEPRFAERLESLLAVRRIDQLVIDAQQAMPADFEDVRRICARRGVSVLSLDEIFEDLTGQCLDFDHNSIELLPRSPWLAAGARLVDITVGLMCLAVCVVVVPLSYMLSRRAIVTRNIVGRRGRVVRIHQLPEADRNAGLLRSIFGWRAFRLLPSAYLVITGRLAVIGPEPLPPTPHRAPANAWALRHTVRPGLTGWAQINNSPGGEESLPFDLYYVRHRSLGFDLGILLRALAGPLISWRAAGATRAVVTSQDEFVMPGALIVSPSDELVSAIVPAFQEGGAIAHSLRMLTEELTVLNVPFELIVVSDGNTDGTDVEAGQVDGPITVIHYRENRGKGYALKRGLAESRGGRVVFIDADMELKPSGIGRLLSLLDAGADAAIGSKRHPESRVNYPPFRRFQSRTYQWLVRRLFGLDVTDTQTGLKAFRGPLVREAAALLTTEGFAFDLELLVELHARGAVIAEGPVELEYAFESTTGPGAVRDVLRDTLRLWHQRRGSETVTKTAWT